MQGSGGNIDLGPVIWWGLAVAVIFAVAVTLAVRLAWRTGRRKPGGGGARKPDGNGPGTGH